MEAQEIQEDEAIKEAPMALDRSNIASTSYHENKKLECKELVNLDAFKKMNPLSVKLATENSSRSST